MSRKNGLGLDDIIVLYDKISRQLDEDREAINDVLGELRLICKGGPDGTGEPMRYVELGDTLAKMTELKMKQTAQVIEVVKAIDKARPKDDEDSGPLTEEDRFAIEKAIRGEVDDEP